MGNYDVSKFVGVRDVFLQTSIGVQLLLTRVKYAQNVRFNVTSNYLLDDSGYYDNHFGFGK